MCASARPSPNGSAQPRPASSANYIPNAGFNGGVDKPRRRLIIDTAAEVLIYKRCVSIGHQCRRYGPPRQPPPPLLPLPSLPLRNDEVSEYRALSTGNNHPSAARGSGKYRLISQDASADIQMQRIHTLCSTSYGSDVGEKINVDVASCEPHQSRLQIIYRLLYVCGRSTRRERSKAIRTLAENDFSTRRSVEKKITS